MPTHKKKDKSDIEHIVQSVFFLRSLRFMKDACMAKCINNLIKFFLNINAVFTKVIITTLSTGDDGKMERGLT